MESHCAAEKKPLRFPSAKEARDWLAHNGLSGFTSEAGRGVLACVRVDDPSSSDSCVWAYADSETLVFLECW